MTHAIRLHAHGGVDQLQWESVSEVAPAPGQLQVRQLAAGVNFIDVYHRTGLYPLKFPSGLGLEACAEVLAVGDGVEGYQAGDRVVYLDETLLDGYSLQRNVAAERAVHVPKVMNSEVAASALIKGLTAWYLLHRSYAIRAGDLALVHSAAGGVGLLLTQWASAIGATVIGTAGSAEKRALAREAGCDDVLDSRATNLAAELRKVCGGSRFQVVYDAVGKDTFELSLDALEPHGTMVTYGNASGPPPPVDVLDLARRGSLKLTRPRLFDFLKPVEHYVAAANDVLSRIADGTLNLHVGQRFAMRDAAAAHEALESRRTVGATVLTP